MLAYGLELGVLSKVCRSEFTFKAHPIVIQYCCTTTVVRTTINTVTVFYVIHAGGRYICILPPVSSRNSECVHFSFLDREPIERYVLLYYRTYRCCVFVFVTLMGYFRPTRCYNRVGGSPSVEQRKPAPGVRVGEDPSAPYCRSKRTILALRKPSGPFGGLPVSALHVCSFSFFLYCLRNLYHYCATSTMIPLLL